METGLPGTQFEAKLQVTTIACEHLSVDENTSPEDRLGEHNLTPAGELVANSNRVIYLKKLLKTAASTGKSEEKEHVPMYD